MSYSIFHSHVIFDSIIIILIKNNSVVKSKSFQTGRGGGVRGEGGMYQKVI
jgi:hypothetical protein